MAKTAIVTDSNSGITQNRAKELGVYVLPMPFLIDNTEYFEDINLTQDEFYKKLADDADVSTSQPAAGDVLDVWDRLLDEEGYDEIVHIPMSSGLSGECQTASMLADDYDGKVCVVDNQRISVTQRQSVLEALELANMGKSAAEIKAYLERTKFDTNIFIMVNDLKYLKKGGRVTPAGAALALVLGIKPVLQISGEKLDAFAKARSIKQAKRIMLDSTIEDLNERFPDAYKEGRVHVQVAHTDNLEAAKEFAEDVKERLGVDEVYIDCLSLSVSCHIGPGSLALAYTIIPREGLGDSAACEYVSVGAYN